MTVIEPFTLADADLDLAIVAEIREVVADELTAAATAGRIDASHENAFALDLVWQSLTDRAKRNNEVLPIELENRIADRVIDDLFGLGGFADYIKDPTIENIFVNGHDQVFIDRKTGRERVGPIAESDEALIQLINNWAARVGRTERRFDKANPRLDLRLPGGHRLHAIMEVTARPTVTIRCPFGRMVRLEDLVDLGTLDHDLVTFLRAAAKSRCNMVIAGGTGSGKTTLLRALLHEVPPEERIITIEDTAELGLGRYQDLHPNVVEMETRQANLAGVGALSMMELTRECLRMSPDRVVLGEVRGAEALYMLKAMSQGNDGSMCTLHSESPKGVLDRVRGYVAEGTSGIPISVIDGFYRNAVDLIIHITVQPNRRRTVSSIVEVQKDSDEGVRYNDLFLPGPDGLATASVTPSVRLRRKLESVAEVTA